jgi:hypothetical protein
LFGIEIFPDDAVGSTWQAIGGSPGLFRIGVREGAVRGWSTVIKPASRWFWLKTKIRYGSIAFLYIHKKFYF